jgi:hypothetical protein
MSVTIIIINFFFRVALTKDVCVVMFLSKGR